MKTEEEVKEKFDEVFFRELDKKKKDFLSKSFRNCKCNKLHRVRGNSKVGFCSNSVVLSKMKDGIFVCNDDETSLRCIHYICVNTEESIVSEFYEEMKRPAICGFKYPKLAVLLWFLQRIPESSDISRSIRLKNTIRVILINLWYLITFKWW